MTSELIPPLWQVPRVFRERMGDHVGRQRAMVADGHLLLVLHAPAKPGEAGRQGRLFWRDPAGQWWSKEKGVGLHSLERHFEEYEHLLGELARQEERASAAAEYLALLEQLSPVRRAATNLHHALQHAREQCPDVRELINLRDRAYELDRSADLLLTDVENALQVAIAKRAEEQSASSHQMSVASHRLNVLAAFFFPIATLMAIFGANLRTGWEEVWPPLPLLSVLAVGLVVGALLTAFVTRKPRA